MKPLWAPWRMDYILDMEKRCQPEHCAFCVDEKTDCDRERLILFRGATGFVIMNRFPYCNGHLLVAPYRHVADLNELEEDEEKELFSLIRLSRNVLQETMQPQGLNIGLNLGEAAGAGIADHLHWHLVPRWRGDTNFMPVLGEVRVIPQHLLRSYEILREAFSGRET